MVRKLLMGAVAACCVALLAAGCAVERPASSAFGALTPDADGTVAIALDEVTDQARFYNYDAHGTTVQLIAVRAEDGTARVALNTCQSCSPSPKAYFQQVGDELQCQNCGLTFSTDTVGAAGSGCNPAKLATLTASEDGTQALISADELDSYAPAFASWEGPTQ